MTSQGTNGVNDRVKERKCETHQFSFALQRIVKLHSAGLIFSSKQSQPFPYFLLCV